MPKGAVKREDARRERSETTKKHILEAALNCFAENGYERSSTEAIAKAAGVSQGIIFHHFGTKEGLFSAIIRTGIEGFEACVGEVETSALPPAEKILLLLRLMGEMSMEHPARTRIIIRQLFQMELDVEKVEDLGILRVVATFRDAFEEGKRSGAFRDIDTESAALSLLGIYLANGFGWSLLGYGDNFVPALLNACAMFLQGVERR